MAILVYKVQITRPATQDAQDYAAYIWEEHKSPEAARRWLEGLYEVINGLVEFPQRFPIIAEAEELGFPYRSFVYHSHRVVYAVHDTDQRVMVHRIYHGARQPLTSEDL